MFSVLLQHINEEIFKPATPEDVKSRKADYTNVRIQDILSRCTKNLDGTYSCEDDVDLGGLGLTKLPVKFKYVGGGFDCGGNKLTSLDGAPQEVGGYFSCSFNELTSLQGAPNSIGGSFSCHDNKLTSLQGAPNSIGGSFSCHDNKVEFTKQDVRKVCNVKGMVFA